MAVMQFFGYQLPLNVTEEEEEDEEEEEEGGGGGGPWGMVST